MWDGILLTWLANFGLVSLGRQEGNGARLLKPVRMVAFGSVGVRNTLAIERKLPCMQQRGFCTIPVYLDNLSRMKNSEKTNDWVTE